MDDVPSDLVIVAADHPSLDDAITSFGAELRAETRYFGRRGQRAARPSPTLVDRLTTPGCANRLAGMIGGRIVAVAAVDDDAADGPELLIAVAADWRGQGLALELGQAIVARATERGCDGSSCAPALGPPTCSTPAASSVSTRQLGPGRLALVRQLAATPA